MKVMFTLPNGEAAEDVSVFGNFTEAKTKLGQLALALAAESVWSNEGYTLHVDFWDNQRLVITHPIFVNSSFTISMEDVPTIADVEKLLCKKFDEEANSRREQMWELENQITKAELQRNILRLDIETARTEVAKKYGTKQVEFIIRDTGGSFLSDPNRPYGDVYFVRFVDRCPTDRIETLQLSLSCEGLKTREPLGPNGREGEVWVARALEYAAHDQKVSPGELYRQGTCARPCYGEDGVITSWRVEKTVFATRRKGEAWRGIEVGFNIEGIPCYSREVSLEGENSF